MSSKATRQAAVRAAKRWQQLRFSTLNDSLLPSSHRAELRLPVQASASASSTASATIRLRLSTNSPAVLQRVESDVDAVFLASPAPDDETNGGQTSVVAETCLNAHAGEPKDVGFPTALEMEATNWLDGVMRSEQHAYNHFTDVVERDDGTLSRGRHPRYAAPTRWLDQLLLDGFVSQRVDARTGFTTSSILRTHEQARWLGKQLPPFQLSPYYSANELLSAWCLFAKTPAELFEGGGNGTTSAGHHVHRAMELALAAALLTSLQGVWLQGALLTDVRSGDVVWIAGPRRSGKTTLALHALAAMPDLQLTAAESFWMTSGAVQPHWARPLLFASLPAPVQVGLGAVMGTVHPNPALATFIQAHHKLPAFTQSEAGMAAFLRNTDAQIWNMSLSYPLSVSKALPGGAERSRWCPAVAGRLKAVVLLDWDVEALHSTSPAVTRGRVGRAPLDDPAAWGDFQRTFADDARAIFKSHYLIRSAYDDTPEALWQRLESLVRRDDVTSPSLCVMTGAVNFERAVDVIHTALESR